jgi:hypothetical protein
MADYFYTVESCVNQNVTGVFSSTTEYSVGQVLSIVAPINCYTIIDVTTTPIPTTLLAVIDEYNSCIECIQNVGGVFIFSECSDPESFVSIGVGDFNTVPSFLQSYYLELTKSTGCYVFVGWSPEDDPTESISIILGPYEECNVCEGYNIPTSANTAYTLCTTDCDGNPVELEFPHPVYTNNYGNAVTQLNAVQLGGPNGLNN